MIPQHCAEAIFELTFNYLAFDLILITIAVMKH